MTRNSLGFLLAPLAAPAVFVVVMLLRGDGAQDADGTSLFWMTVLAVIAAYLVTALLGLPLHLLLRRRGCQGCAWYMAGGALIAFVPFLPGMLAEKGFATTDLLVLLGIVCAVGLLTGLLFWLIAVRGQG